MTTESSIPAADAAKKIEVMKKMLVTMQSWFDNGSSSITLSDVVGEFGLNPQIAAKLLNCFYETRRKGYDLHRGFIVVPDGIQNADEVPCGHVMRESRMLEEEGKGTVFVEKRLFSVHVSALDDDDLLPSAAFRGSTNADLDDMPVEEKFLVVDSREKDSLSKEAQKRKDENPVNKMFEAACNREKFASPKGKKNVEPVRPAEEFFTPSPSKKKKPTDTSPAAGASSSNAPNTHKGRNLIRELKDSMADVFTVENENENQNEPGNAGAVNVNDDAAPEPQPPAPARRTSPRKKQRQPSPEFMDTNDEENDDQAPKEKTVTVTRMENVTETYLDEDGMMETRVTRKPVAHKEVVVEPPPAKKAKTTGTTGKAAKGKAKEAGKNQASITSFFKKKA